MKPLTLYIYRVTLYVSLWGAAMNETHGVPCALQAYNLVWSGAGGWQAQEQDDIQENARKELERKLV